MPPDHPRRSLRVLLADDQAVVREGLVLLVADQPDMEVVAQASGGRDAVRIATALRPDVVVLDASMRDLGGAQAMEQIRAALPEVRLLALARRTDLGFLHRMLDAGASGYLLKRTAAEALITAIRTVAAGEIYLDPALAGALAARDCEQPGAACVAPSNVALSERETQVLRFLAWGSSNGEAAARLGLGVETVEACKARAFEKLQLHSRAGLLRHALAQGWLREDKTPA